MKKASLVVLILAALSTNAQEKPVIVVEQFTVSKNVTWAGGPWPYDMAKLQDKLSDRLKIYLNNAEKVEIVSVEPSATSKAIYHLGGEVLEWHHGNKALIITGSSLGRESAKIRYWLIDKNNKKVFEREDTIRTSMNGGGPGTPLYQTVGSLAKPFASKIVDRLNDAKVL